MAWMLLNLFCAAVMARWAYVDHLHHNGDVWFDMALVVLGLGGAIMSGARAAIKQEKSK